MRVRTINTLVNSEIKVYGDKSIAFIKNQRFLSEAHNYDIDALIIENKSFLPAIRKNDSLYLKPVFLLGAEDKNVDGTFEEQNPYTIFSKIEKIAKSILPFEKLSLPDNSHEKIVTKLLRYLLSRSMSLHPVRSRNSKIGYTFDLLEDFSIESNRLRLMSIMESFVKKGYFQKKTVDKVNLCHSCEGNYLNFTECCTKCNGIDLKSENLIHHFRCAYIGPESDFVNNEQLKCPKCDHILKHIGIDYDKPSEIHTCNNCNHASQETKMKAKCVDCGKENELDQLTTHAIYNYKPTEKGHEKALSEGHAPVMDLYSENESSHSDATTPFAIYTLLKKHEIQKTGLYKNQIYEAILSVEQSITKNLNDGLKKSLLEELASIIKPYLKNHDIITITPEYNISILLTDYTSQLAQQMKETIDYNIDKMLRNNGWADNKAISTTLCEIRK